MANPAQDVFSEHLGVISALRENYARGEDAAAVASLVRSQQEVAAACSGREERVQEAIRELTGRVQRAEAEATYPAEEGAHEAAVAAAAGASREAQENVNALNSQLQALQQQRQGIRSQVAALQRKAEHIEQLVVDAEPRTRHQMAMYAHVCKITWQFDQPARVAGTMHLPSKPMSRFDLDPATTSSFEIVNLLWDLMGTD